MSFKTMKLKTKESIPGSILSLVLSLLSHITITQKEENKIYNKDELKTTADILQYLSK